MSIPPLQLSGGPAHSGAYTAPVDIGGMSLPARSVSSLDEQIMQAIITGLAVAVVLRVFNFK